MSATREAQSRSPSPEAGGQGKGEGNAIAYASGAGRGGRGGSDAPFYLALLVLGGFYVVLVVALVAADLGFLYVPGWWRWMNDWTWIPAAVLAPFVPLAQSPEIRFAVYLSLLSCSIAAALSVAVGIPLGYLMSRFEFPGKRLVDAVIDVPIVLPPLVVGLSLLILFQTAPGKAIEYVARNHMGQMLAYVVVPAGMLLGLWAFMRSSAVRPDASRALVYGVPALAAGAYLAAVLFTPLGARLREALQFQFGTGITYAVPAVVLAQFSVAAAFSVRTMRVTFDQLSPRTEQVALTLGCTRGEAFRRVVLPEAWRGVLTALTLAWARALGEFGPILVFAGAVRRKTEVLSTTVYLELSIGNIDAAVAVSMMMIVVALAVLVLVRVLGGGQGGALGRAI